MMFLRNVLERLGRQRVFKRRLPAEFDRAPILVSPEASLSFWKPGLESDLFEFATEFVTQGSIVWDIGANVGLFAVAAAQRSGPAGRVVAVEADTWLVGLLRQSSEMQGPSSAPISVIPVAVSNRVEVVSFHVAKSARATNFLAAAGGSTQTGGVRSKVQVVSITLDWLMQQRPAPSVLKIDVEGAEAAVFAGAEELLATAKPVVLCEVYEENADFVTQILLQHGYTLYDWDTHPRQKIHRTCYNTLALPPAH